MPRKFVIIWFMMKIDNTKLRRLFSQSISLICSFFAVKQYDFDQFVLKFSPDFEHLINVIFF